MAVDRAVFVLAVSVLVVIFIRGGEVQAKRGCASFGHSCYGGMGKRSELENTNEEALQNNLHQDTENAAYGLTGPRPALTNTGFPTGPFRYSRFTPVQYEQMNKFVREWIINYLRKEEETEKK